jgi:hypothetical protein
VPDGDPVLHEQHRGRSYIDELPDAGVQDALALAFSESTSAAGTAAITQSF